MRVLVQRVKRASVSIGGSVSGEIDAGLLVFLAVRKGDVEQDAEYLARRCSDLRIFGDPEGKMNLSLKDVGGSALVISQFTLYADTRRGNRPSFTDSARPDDAERLYEAFVGQLKRIIGEDRVTTGQFGAMMDVELINDGPVTVTVDSKNSDGRELP